MFSHQGGCSMQKPILYRNRLIPMESVCLNRDTLLFRDDSLIITSWDTLRPKADLAYGYSCYYLKRGLKISRLFDHSGHFMYWYCDIIHTDYNAQEDTYVFTDLLADVIVKPDGSARVLDLDELSEAFEKQLLSAEFMSKALRQLDDLLQMIYRDRFEALTEPLLKAEQTHPHNHETRRD